MATPASRSEFWTTFGGFINLYATAESHLHYVFRNVTKLDDEASRAITGGMRLADIIAAIKRLAKPPRVSAEIEAELLKWTLVLGPGA